MTASFSLRSLTATSTTLFEAPNLRTIVQLRWVVILASCCLMVFAHETLLGRNFVYAFAAFHILTNAFLYCIDRTNITSFRFFSTLIIFDTLALSFSLIVTGNLGSDLYLTYFLIIIIAAFWQDIRWSLAFAALISLLYSSLLFMAAEQSTYLLLRVPFLFITSLFFGYFAQLVSTERTLREKAETEARKDFLTGLPNRKAFEERMRQEEQRAWRYHRPLSLLMLDIDNFKAVNDSLGHQWGDTVLQVVSKILSSGLRQSDFAARYGGEEFAVILPETKLEGAVRLGDRIRLAIKETPLETPKGLLIITVSVGASSNDLATDDHLKLDREADVALYMAKRRGKDRVEACLI